MIKLFIMANIIGTSKKQVHAFKLCSAILIVICIGALSSCSKEDPVGNSSSSLIGKWSFPTTDLKGNAITGYWTFNTDGTVLITDQSDVFNGQTTKYAYDSETKKLTLAGGLVVYQLDWKSSAQFYIQSIDQTFKKVP